MDKVKIKNYKGEELTITIDKHENIKLMIKEALEKKPNSESRSKSTYSNKLYITINTHEYEVLFYKPKYYENQNSVIINKAVYLIRDEFYCVLNEIGIDNDFSFEEP